jgi:hypothetical protein
MATSLKVKAEVFVCALLILRLVVGHLMVMLNVSRNLCLLLSTCFRLYDLASQL